MFVVYVFLETTLGASSPSMLKDRWFLYKEHHTIVQRSPRKVRMFLKGSLNPYYFLLEDVFKRLFKSLLFS